MKLKESTQQQHALGRVSFLQVSLRYSPKFGPENVWMVCNTLKPDAGPGALGVDALHLKDCKSQSHPFWSPRTSG